MKGKYRVYITYTSRDKSKVLYYLDIKRKITIITGQSATGKTTICDALLSKTKSFKVKRFRQDNKLVDTFIEAINVKSYTDLVKINVAEHSIIFIDESTLYLNDFSNMIDAIRKSDNYFVLVIRDLKFKKSDNLNYSTNEIYELVRDTETVSDSEIYRLRSIAQRYSQQNLYNYLQLPTINDNTIILVEDAKAGLKFFTKLFNNNLVLSVKGKFNFYEVLRGKQLARDINGKQYTITINDDNNDYLLIADGAAFGCCMSDLIEFLEYYSNKIKLYLSESFEWLLLQCFKYDKTIIAWLNFTYDYLDATVTDCQYTDDRFNNWYGSWEKFYTYRLIEYSSNLSKSYKKESMPDYYLEFIDDVKALISFNAYNSDKTHLFS